MSRDPSKFDLRPGDVIEWIGVPILVLEVPSLFDMQHDNWNGRVAYLRMPHERQRATIRVGEPMGFTMHSKLRWAGELTDEEWAKVAKLLLTGQL